jgi:ribosomal protein S11
VVLTARPSLYGLPLTGASVTVVQTTPGTAAVNWLANSPITAADYAAAAAAAQAATSDTDSLGIKQLALKTQGINFNPISNTATAALADPTGTGTYSITGADTSIPGTSRIISW